MKSETLSVQTFGGKKWLVLESDVATRYMQPDQVKQFVEHTGSDILRNRIVCPGLGFDTLLSAADFFAVLDSL